MDIVTDSFLAFSTLDTNYKLRFDAVFVIRDNYHISIVLLVSFQLKFFTAVHIHLESNI